MCTSWVCWCFCVYLQLADELGPGRGLRGELCVSPTELFIIPVHTFQLLLRRLQPIQKCRLLLDTKRMGCRRQSSAFSPLRHGPPPFRTSSSQLVLAAARLSINWASLSWAALLSSRATSCSRLRACSKINHPWDFFNAMLKFLCVYLRWTGGPEWGREPDGARPANTNQPACVILIMILIN